MQALPPTSLHFACSTVQDFSLATQLVEVGEAQLQWGPAFVSGATEGGDPAAEFFSLALRDPDVRLLELVLDPCIRPLNPSGSQGLLLTRPGNLLHGQEASAVGPGRGRRVTGSAAGLGRLSVPASRCSTAVPRTPRMGRGAELAPSKTTSFAVTLASLPATPAAHTVPLHSTPGSAMASHERCWTARTDRTEHGDGARRSLAFQGLHSAEPDWTLGGWASSSADLEAARGQGAAAAAGRGAAAGAAGAVSASAATGAGAPGDRNANLPKSRVQRRQESEFRRAQDPPRPMTPLGAAALASALTINPGARGVLAF